MEVRLLEPQFKGDDERQPFVTIMKLGSWKPVLMEYDEEEGFHMPWQTGICGYPTKEKALPDAKAWAKAEGIAFKEWWCI